MGDISAVIYFLGAPLVALALVLAGLRSAFANATLGRAQLWLAGILVVQLCLEVLVNAERAPAKALWLGLLLASAHLLGPLLLLAFKRADVLRRWDIWLAVAGMVAVLPLVYTTQLQSTYSGSRIFSSGYWLWVNCLDGVSLLLFLCHWPTCVYRIRRDIVAPTSVLSWLRSGAQDASAFNQVLVALLCVQWLLALVKLLHCLTLGPPTLVSMLMSWGQVAMLLGLLLLLLAKPQVGIKPVAKSKKYGRYQKYKKYQKSGLVDADKQRIAERIQQVMADPRWVASPTRKLDDLATSARASEHYCSQVINELFDCSFFELLNRARVKLASERLVASPECTILDVALASGFNSKSTFNAAFKRYLGCTPSEYRRANTAKSSLQAYEPTR
ncbi:helix-turn-helix domain-containing protein [Teredinibacter turnerae]|uniref:helix-turn-helix domain-containing protein n=1 Tax=Teredinibacter turnerae TaxID=2426 RepID=UPI000378E7A2|nr:helix-turn-helix domain-containing protein [Teredinibacter turnerae]